MSNQNASYRSPKSLDLGSRLSTRDGRTAASLNDTSVSPLESPGMDFPLPPAGHVIQQWRPSVDSVATQEHTARDMESWTPPPPLPSAPREIEPETWRKRSQKRTSYANHMANYSTTDVPPEWKQQPERRPSVRSLDASIRSARSRNFSRPTRLREDRRASVDLNWKLASFNPQNWSTAKKWVHTIACGVVAFTCTLASSIIPPSKTAVDGPSVESSIIAVLPMAVFAAGLAFGPTLDSISAEFIGRKIASIIFMAAFALLTLGSAFVTSFYPFVACRAVAGILASPALHASLVVVLDIWHSANRQLPLAIYSLLLLLGLTAGPLIGRYVLFFKDRSWTQYVILFACAPCILLLVSIRETHKDTVRRRTESGKTCGRLNRDHIVAVGRPFYLFCIRPKVLLCTLCASWNFATFYAIFTTFPQNLIQLYKTPSEAGGLPIAAMAAGVVAGGVVLATLVLLTKLIAACKHDHSGPVHSEKERAMSNHVPMESHASFTPFRHNASAMGGLTCSRNPSRSSLPYLKNEVSTSVQPRDENVDVASAVKRYLNNLSSNDGNHTTRDHIAPLLDQANTFPDLCLLLEGYDFSFDRNTLLDIMEDALQTTKEAEASSWPLPPSAVVASSLRTTPTNEQLWPFTLDPPPALQQFRNSAFSKMNLQSWKPQEDSSTPRRPLWIGLLGSLLSTGALFMFGWTASIELSWIIPVVAMGIFACGGVLVLASTTEYLMSSCAEENGEHAVAVCNVFRWLFAASFSIVAVPLFRSMDIAWASSVLGFINAAGSVMLLILLIISKVSRSTPLG